MGHEAGEPQLGMLDHPPAYPHGLTDFNPGFIDVCGVSNAHGREKIGCGRELDIVRPHSQPHVGRLALPFSRCDHEIQFLLAVERDTSPY